MTKSTPILDQDLIRPARRITWYVVMTLAGVGLLLRGLAGGNLRAEEPMKGEGREIKVELTKEVGEIFTTKVATYDAAKNEATLILECKNDLTAALKFRLEVFRKNKVSPFALSFLDQDKVGVDFKSESRIDSEISAKQGDRIKIVVPMPGKDKLAKVKTIRVDELPK